jgi:hypothetical protein
MGLIRFLLELDVLASLLLLEELAIPYLRDRPKFPLICWLLKRLALLLPQKTAADSLMDSAKGRRRAALLRIEAARMDLEAAGLEKEADEMESETNQLREGDPT